jgi:integrase/recombinase XerD
MDTPQPKLEFFRKEGERSPQRAAATPPKPPIDVRWMRVQEYVRAHDFRPNTRKAYERELHRFLDWTEKAWVDITPRDIANYKHYLEQKGLAIASVARAIAPVKSLFKWLVTSGYLSQNPTLNTKLPTPPEPQPQHFEDTEVEALYAALEYRGQLEVRDRAILTVLEFGGLRPDEVSRLNLEDFEVEPPTSPNQPSWGSLTIREAKDDSTGRVPLPPGAVSTILAYLEERQRRGESLDDPQVPLFLAQSFNPKRRGTRLGYDGIYDLLKDLGQIAGIPNCHPHRFRHTFGTRLVLMGMDSYLGRKLMRQRSERAYRRYTEFARQIAAEDAYKAKFQKHPEGDK